MCGCPGDRGKAEVPCKGGGEASALRPLGLSAVWWCAEAVAAYTGRQGSIVRWAVFFPGQRQAVERPWAQRCEGGGVLELVGGPVALKPLGAGSWEEALGFFSAGLLGAKPLPRLLRVVAGGGMHFVWVKCLQRWRSGRVRCPSNAWLGSLRSLPRSADDVGCEKSAESGSVFSPLPMTT